MNQAASPDPVDYDKFRSVTFYGVLGALCPLIPIPLLDDWLLGKVKKRMVGELTAKEGLQLSEEEKETLAGLHEERRFPGVAGTLYWAGKKVAKKVVKKVFKKVVYVFAIKEGIEVGTEVVHEGYLLLQAVRKRGDEQTFQAVRVREAIRNTLGRLDLKPVRDTLKRVFDGSLSVMIKGAGILGKRFANRQPDPDEDGLTDETMREEEQAVGGLVDRATAALWTDQQHLAQARSIFFEELGTDPGRESRAESVSA